MCEGVSLSVGSPMPPRPIELIERIETELDMAAVRVRGEQVWPFLRNLFRYSIIEASTGVAGTRPAPIWKELCRFRNAAWKPWAWCRSYPYVVISSTLQRRELGGHLVDKGAEWIGRELGRERVIVLERPSLPGGSDFRPWRYADQNVLSLDPIYAWVALARAGACPPIENEHALVEAQKRVGVSFPYLQGIARFLRAKALFHRWLSRRRPRVLFVTCYYGLVNQAAIAAAKGLGIVTVELQHGLVSDTHDAYRLFCPMDRTTFPDFLFAQGGQVKHVFSLPHAPIDADRVLITGDAYVEAIRAERCSNLDVPIPRDPRRATVLVTLQTPVQRELIDIVCQAATQVSGIRFDLLPRLPSDASSIRSDRPSNVSILRDSDFYRSVACCDWHVTVYSTCAVEAPAFGTRNILVDVHGWAESYLGSLLGDGRVTHFVQGAEGLVQALRTLPPQSREVTLGHYQDSYARATHQRLRSALSSIGAV